MKAVARLGLVAGALVALAGSANAAVIVIGNSRAAACYQAAEFQRPSEANVNTCLEALRGDALSESEAVATNVNLGILYFYRANYDAALARFDRAMAMDPTEPEAVLNKAITLLRRDEAGSQALPLFSRAIEMGTREPALAYYGRGLAHELNGDLTAAYLDIRRASEIDPEWDVPARDLGRFIVQQGT